MPNVYQIIFEGSGGQGILMGGKILAQGAVTGGLNAAHSQSYGAQARGGFSSTEIVISSGEITYPLVENPGIVIALTREAYKRNVDYKVKNGVLFIYDTSIVEEHNSTTIAKRDINLLNNDVPFHGYFGVPFDFKSRQLNNPKGITLMALGALIELTGVVEQKYIERAIVDNFVPEIARSNIDCFRHGSQLARKALAII